MPACTCLRRESEENSLGSGRPRVICVCLSKFLLFEETDFGMRDKMKNSTMRIQILKKVI